MQKLKRVVNNLLFNDQKYSTNKSQGTAKHQSLKALNRLNLSLGDVRDVFEPYLAIFLASDRHWNQAQVGIALSTTSIVGILAQTPVGALVDASQNKPVLVAIATLAIAASYMVIVHFTNLFAVVGAQAVIGVSAVIIAPAVVAISLGLVGQDRLRLRVGQNEAFNHTGNVGAAIIAGLLGQFVGRVWIFYFLMILCFATIISVFQIRNRDIDNSQARADDKENNHGQQRITVKKLLSDRRMLIFASSVIMFYLANAALLPLVSQELSGGKQNASSVYVSAAVALAQLIMIPIAAWTGKTAERWGRKPLLLIAFSALLLRALLYTMSHNPWFLVSVQVLDGIASGIFTVIVVIVIADLTQGTGRFNLAQGVINTMIGIGSAISNLAGGFLVKVAGYNVGFMTMAGIAAVGLGWSLIKMPETMRVGDRGVSAVKSD